MSRAFFRSSLLALASLGIASSAAAHHPPRFERCKRITFTGEVERVEWVNPHVLLFMEADDGSHYQMGWLNIRGLERAGIDTTTLKAGDRLTVEGGIRPKDVSREPILISSMHRLSDGWEWSQPLQGC